MISENAIPARLLKLSGGGLHSKVERQLANAGLIDENGITEAGLEALKPYKVDNAIIMAAGLSTRFVPISLEMPKGLLEVKGEILIERQIRQLQEAGIKNIVLVLGYKKEAFFYLEKKFGVKIIINPDFHLKNNTYTLWLARKYLGNSYICSSDDYFSENVFEEYVYGAYYASVHVNEKMNEWYMEKDSNGNIISVSKGGKGEGDIMIGHVYWNREFSRAMMGYLEDSQKTGEYDGDLWEQILIDHAKELPPMRVKTYPKGTIFEFDSLDELRTFDEEYVQHTHSRIISNIASIMGCDESDITGFKPIKKGMTNTSFIFEAKGKKYVYRHPGEGTDKIISRKHERESVEIAKSLGIDPTYIYMDEDKGWKISHYALDARIPDCHDPKDNKRVIDTIHRLHAANIHVDWEFDIFKGILDIERQVLEKTDILDPNYQKLKGKIVQIYDNVKDDGMKKCFCHCDTSIGNWMFSSDKTILIDWEYAGEADPGCDVASYVMDAKYTVDEGKEFIREYLGNEYSPSLEYHYLAYVALMSFYWFVWGLYREACGAVMGEGLYSWYSMARDYAEYLSGGFES